jgi:hypothetical protein
MAWDNLEEEVEIRGQERDILVEGSYIINLWTSKPDGDTDPAKINKYWGSPNVPGSQYAPMLLDGQWKDMEPWETDQPLPFESSKWTPNAHEMQRACIKRHAPYHVFALMLDWSIRKVTIKELWTLKWNREWIMTPEMLPEWPEWMQDVPDPFL